MQDANAEVAGDAGRLPPMKMLFPRMTQGKMLLGIKSRLGSAPSVVGPVASVDGLDRPSCPS